MVHDRITDESELENIADVDLGLCSHAGDQGVDSVAHSPCHLHLATRIHHQVGYAAHQILTKADLRIHNAVCRDDLAAREVTQVRRHRR